MNAPAPIVPKDPLSQMLIMGALICASLAFIELDRVIKGLDTRVFKLEMHNAAVKRQRVRVPDFTDFAGAVPEPADDVPAAPAPRARSSRVRAVPDAPGQPRTAPDTEA